MNTKTNGNRLKVNHDTSFVVPPYRKPTPEEQQRFEKSRQLSILPMSSDAALILQPYPGELLQQNIQKINKVVKPKPKPRTKSSTKSITTTNQQPTTTPKRSNEDLKKQVQKEIEWLNNLRICDDYLIYSD